ncbi:MAG: acyl-CoA dehydrogenase [Porticoccaceae bacterium]|nr:MAG: acyl-CoA dehydrogenase [Porticoccaceae bacterium]
MSEYREELRASARKVVEDAGTPASEGAVWPVAVELGWLLTTLPEARGGLGLGWGDAVVLHEELGRGLAGAPLLSAALAAEALAGAENEAGASWLERLLAGEPIAVPLADGALAAEGDGLSGRLEAVPSAAGACALVAWTEGAEALWLIPRDAPAVAIETPPYWDETRAWCAVELRGVPRSAAVVLARGERAARLVEALTVRRALGIAADAVGGGAQLLELTLEHLRTRRQFGRPLALFQALKHRVADLATELAAAEALLHEAAAAVDAGRADAFRRAWEAKLVATAAYARCAEEALQLHGGIGMAVEHPCHLFLKRALLDVELAGDPESLALAVGDAVLREAG